MKNIVKAGAEEIPLPEFGAVGREVVLERGSIFLLRATDPSDQRATCLLTRVMVGASAIRSDSACIDRRLARY
jgi:hypothetical protein